jgi:hypothetical protein
MTSESANLDLSAFEMLVSKDGCLMVVLKQNCLTNEQKRIFNNAYSS